MRRRDFCQLAATCVAGGLAANWNTLADQTVRATADAVPPAAASTLARVRVHPGWRGLVTGDHTPFVPFGVAYFRPNTGWSPQMWRPFNPGATERDFQRLKNMGLNTVRLFMFGADNTSFYLGPDNINHAVVNKFDQFLELAEKVGIRVQPCAPAAWNGQNGDPFADERILESREQFWHWIAARYKNRGVILAYELANEPVVQWKTHAMQLLWNQWNHKSTPIPRQKDNADHGALLAYQLFREHVADQWTRRQVAAIKQADPQALVTVGLIQGSVPATVDPPLAYSGFRPQRQAKFLDFMEIHFYPLTAGGFTYQSEAAAVANLSYLESILRETAAPGLPTVLAEFGWYGGGICPNFGPPIPASQQQQADFCAREVATSTPLACGWLNWAMYNDPVSPHVTRFSGLFTADGKEKLWGRRFGEIARQYQYDLPPVPLGQLGPRPELPWDQCLTSPKAVETFQMEYLEAFKRERYES